MATALLEQEVSAFALALPEGGMLTAVLERVERRGPGDLAWVGRVEGMEPSSVTVTLKNGFAVGHIATPDAVYELRPLADGRQSLERLDVTRFPECAGGIEPASAYLGAPEAGPDSGPNGGPGLATRAIAGDAPDSIDVMGVYTPQARSGAGGTAQIEATIQGAVDNANTSFANSNSIPRFNLVHTAEINYNDSGDMTADLYWLADSTEVAALRDQYSADMVGMIVNTGSACGVGFVQRSPGASFEGSAFQVTHRTCAVGNLSYAHEHGHNMGLEHNPENSSASPSQASYPWSYGHWINGSYRTVMSYSNPCSQRCTRVTQYSNPDISFNGVPTGIAEQRDNARTLDLTAQIVADFRQSATCGNGVIEGGEQCDGAALGGASCSGNGCSGGAVSCTASCTLDFSACTGCSLCDNDGICEAGEDCGNCANDCPSGSGASCGNGICEIGDGEDCLSCALDCAGQQGGNPNNRFCCGDGAGTNPVGCSDGRCSAGGVQCSGTATGAWCCGDGICEGGETSNICGIDCGPPPMCLGAGAPCGVGGDCCSGSCKGKGGNKTCQ